MSAQRIEAFDIASRVVGRGHPCLVIAEVAMAHDGSLGSAHAFIDAVAGTGADAIKFQTHIASAESTAAEPFRVKFSRQDATRYDYWRRTEFTLEQWHGLADHAKQRNLIFLSSPFSEEAVALLERVGVPAWKIGSGETSNDLLVRRVASTGRPVLLSSGMSTLEELDRAVSLVREAGAPLGVFQCTSEYPCPPEHLGLEQIAALSARFECPVGLSDHSGTIFAGVGAAVLGASMLEVHVTLSREAFGPDVIVSLTTDELTELVEGVRFLGRALGSPVDKDRAAANLDGMRAMFTKSLVARRPLPAGTVITRDDVAAKKPGTGLPPSRLDELIGMRLLRAVAADDQLRPEDLEPVAEIRLSERVR
jgi:N-acetylneuraminate synthase